MRTLLLLVTAAAVALALGRLLGTWLVAWVLGLWVIVVATCLATLAAYCRGRRQTLFLGALLGAVGALLAGPGPVASVGFAVFQLVAAVAAAATASITRRFLEGRGWHEAGAAERDRS